MIETIKNNVISVRMTDTVLSYLESQEGDNVSQKFENMVLFAMETEKERKDYLEFLDAEIREKRDLLLCLRRYDGKLEFMKVYFSELIGSVSSLLDTSLL